VVSIFVNPTQFGPAEDFSRYPRDLERDSALLEKEGVDLIWAPTPEQMYSADFQTWVEVDQLTKPLEGERRPGHFRGVTTVVAKLFNGVLPQKAYFGQKDAQQAVVIRRMVQDLNFPIEIVVCPIVRESDGLAMSSRNQYLNPQERQAALVLSRSLKNAREAFDRGERRAEILREILLTTLHADPLARVQYVSCTDPVTLQEQKDEVASSLLSMAVYIGNTRLIDNCLLG
jgi:pantoate--beta-alanine ligase